MAGRDKSGGGGRSEEDRLRDLAARERARLEGKRPPPSFGPSTRAGRERAASRDEQPAGQRRSGQTARSEDASFDFDFARPSTRVAGGDGNPPPRTTPIAPPPVESAPAAAPAVPEQARAAATATAIAPPSTPPTPPGGDPSFAPLRSASSVREERQAARAARRAESKGPTSRAPEARAKSASGVGGVVAGVAASRKSLAITCAAVVLLGAGLAMAIGGGDDATAPDTPAAKRAKGPSPYGTPTPTPLPPETRVVAFAGAPQADELGILGTMPIEKASDRLERQSRPYDRKSRPVLPAFDLIATIANAHPGPNGKYRTRQTGKTIARYLRAARRHDAALILDVQPGTSNFVDELKPLEKWLKEPDVHLALDPEWRMRPGVQPGSEIGWVSAGEITATLNIVARIVRANDLPPKLVIVHRFTDGMIKNLEDVDVPDEVRGIISIDGVGDRTAKIHTYDRIAPTLPKPWRPGFKVFYEEDAEAGGIMYGSQVMHLKPRPDVVLYE